ncbi:MAG TPA: hypothetical protein DEQ20_10835 [Desulfobulbaceae bacterium]|nr:MAG: hypothetical protein A2520_05730 [Deltaproteobacteria bacterium RIFOXYD12_FULL_53_23]HCC55398.1 hypothetical protein [Desulfobulbaceae bacterium]
MQRSIIRLAGEILLLVLFVAGCASHEVAIIPYSQTATQEAGIADAFGNQRSASANESFLGAPPVAEDVVVVLAGRGRATGECFQLRPGGMDSKKKKASRCEPQSLPFARCRSGINTCRLGHENGPLTWFACEQQNGNTSAVPQPGSILILAANNRRKMPTGHVAYVEKAVAQNATVYRLVFSHTNYDRKCSLETNIEATYNSAARTLDIHGGAWGAWGKGLPVAGFILN